MTAQLRTAVGICADGFSFSGQPRKFADVTAVPFRWPSKADLANDYISEWREMARAALADLRLSKDTMKAIASHTSRRNGTCRLTDRALSERSGRSLASTKRDIHRLKKLGLIIAEYEKGDVHQERIRILKLAVPSATRSSQRIPPSNSHEVVSTYPPYVDPLDKGERCDV